MTIRKCLACGHQPAITTEPWPALCSVCLDRTGESVEPGDLVVCEVDEFCSGTVDRIEDDGQMVVVKTDDGNEAWVPIQEIVRVEM